MERLVAINKLGKLLGKSLGYRVNDKAPGRDERLAAQTALPAATQERRLLSEKLEARRKALLKADAEYQSLSADYIVAREQVDELSSISRTYKFTVGVSSSMFFIVKAEGDSWEEVIAKLTEKK